MNGSLPAAFLERMQHQLGSEFGSFVTALAQQRYSALRLHPTKGSSTTVKGYLPSLNQPVPWSSNAFYYDPETHRPGFDPLHWAGAYYVQEPSAMAVVPLLDVKPGQRCLDLCAAPGGKSMQIADALENSGLLIVNEYTRSRVKPLGENLERWGISRGILVNESADHLADRWPAYFDRILVDAPCSGEGMFRKDSEAITTWSVEKTMQLAHVQKELLHNAQKMLRPGGRMVYSTCTFNTTENEDQIAEFLQTHPWMIRVDERRIWPHKDKGEGHYGAVLVKQDNPEQARAPSEEEAPSLTKEVRGRWHDATTEWFVSLPPCFQEGNLYLRGDRLYLGPSRYPTIEGLSIVRVGTEIAQLKRNRIEPSHGLALLPGGALRRIRPASRDEAIAYLQGHVLSDADDKGWGTITFADLNLGWAKAAAGQWKNHYPKGLRLRLRSATQNSE